MTATLAAHKLPNISRFFTIGYEGMSVDDFFVKLGKAGINCLIDVRRNPISRKSGFSKKALANYCLSNNITYHHYPALGIPTAKRQNIKTREDYNRLFAYYRREIIPCATDEIDCLTALCTSQTSALLCFESSPDFCHRSCLAQELCKLSELRVIHI
jgi:uncharacterized protein (DUF488 family)